MARIRTRERERIFLNTDVEQMPRVAARNAQWENRPVRFEFPKKKQTPRGEKRRRRVYWVRRTKFRDFEERESRLGTRNNRTPGSVVRVPNVQTKTAANAGRGA